MLFFEVLLKICLVKALVVSAELSVSSKIAKIDDEVEVTYPSNVECTESRPDAPLSCNGRTDDTINIKLSVDSTRIDYALRIFTKCIGCTPDLPILVGVNRQKDVISWKLPVVIPLGTSHNSHTKRYTNQSMTYNDTSRTLRPLEELKDRSGKRVWKEDIEITFRTRGSSRFELGIWMCKFELKLNEKEEVTLSPTKPKYFKFILPPDIPRALLDVKSTNDSCMTLSIQDSQNPVHDLYSNVKFDGHYQTVNKTGSMWISKEQFNGSIYVVMVGHPDDSECHLNPFKTFHRLRKIMNGFNNHTEKTVTIIIRKSETVHEFTTVMIGTILGFLVFSLGALLMACMQTGWDVLRMKKDAINTTCNIGNNVAMRKKEYRSDESLGKKKHGMDDFVRYSVLYMKGFWLVAIFYSIPVVQLMLTWEKMTNENGNKDQCFFNFQCAHAWIGKEKKLKISDSNHVFSNIGYLILGMTSLICIRIHQKRAQMHAKNPKHQNTSGEPKDLSEVKNGSSECGIGATYILKDYGLYYALGSAIIMQGLMSACYHICPNNVNFQFDTIFMFSIAILVMTTVYNRLNPWQAVSVFTVYGVLSVIILLGILGVYFDADFYTSGNGKGMLLMFRWVSFGITVVSCFLLSYLCYSERRVNFNLTAVKSLFGSMFRRKKRLWDIQSGELKSFCTPNHPKRLMLLVFWNIINIVLSSFIVVRFDKTTYLEGMLYQLTFNTITLLVVYIILKKMYKEKITAVTIIQMSFTGVVWCIAIYYFREKTKNDELSPANSRMLNKPCKRWAGNFYDEHDLWHFFSSVGLFLNLMIVMTLDDRLMKGKDDIQRLPRVVKTVHHRPVTAIGEV